MISRPVDSVRVTVAGSWSRLRRFDERQVEPLKVDLGKLPEGDHIFELESLRMPAGLRVTAINPPSIRLVFEERREKTVVVRPIFVGAPARGHRLGDVVATPATVKVRGPRRLIDGLTEVDTRPIDVTGRDAGDEVRVELGPTDELVELVDRPTIVVRYGLSLEQGQRTIGSLKVTVRPAPGVAAAPPLTATTAPTKVRLNLRGPKNVLDALDPSDIDAYVTWHAEDGKAARPARVIVEGLPPGVALEVDPHDVTLLPKP
jgi:YbbR domain-containing protein